MSTSLPLAETPKPKPPPLTEAEQERTGLGNYFIANYPPFAYWKPEHLQAVDQLLNSPAPSDVPLGLYLHIPFCRKRCKFCYFRVYTDKNGKDVENYMEAMLREVELYAARNYIGRRPLHYVYFGGGTPSYLSAQQLTQLFAGVKARMNWEAPAEVTFECEPGTLQEHKLVALRDLGVTRLSLGVENFDDKLLEVNGRAHRSPEIHKAYGWIRNLGFEQVNIDLIAGMVGETWENWKVCIEKTKELKPESVTIYQMELPYNTVFSKEMRTEEGEGAPHFADWPTKRAWVEYAFAELAKVGYAQSSAYTMVRTDGNMSFVYRDALWHGADLIGAGVASFGHLGGMHVQNLDTWETYLPALQGGKLPWSRALPLEKEEKVIREMVLQLKTGKIDPGYFQKKFDVNLLSHFRPQLDELASKGILEKGNETLKVTPAGMLQIDKQLPTFFLEQHVGSRYT